MHAYQARERKSKAVNNNRSQQPAHRGAAFQSSSDTPVVQARIQNMANNSSHVKQLQAYQEMADNSNAPIQKKENKTGLPDRLKSGIERLSGIDISDVKVHYNSAKPAQLRAMAYAQGTDIYIAPGQEKHLPHEAWHAVQQKQGRVKPTTHTTQKKEAAPTAQLYTTIPRKINSEELILPSFTNQYERQNEGTKQEGFILRYIEGNTSVNEMHVSASADMAINPDSESEHKVVFMSGEKLASANQKLASAKSDFELQPGGQEIVIKHHPQENDKKTLIQVEARYTNTDKNVSELETRCDLFHKYITKRQESITKLFKTAIENKKQVELTDNDRKDLDEKLNGMKLEPGDAFEIVSSYTKDLRLAWNEHYAAIVAVDGPDQVTLENYNRLPGHDLTLLLEKQFGDTAKNLTEKMMDIKNKLFEWDFDLGKDVPTKLDDEVRDKLTPQFIDLKSKVDKWNLIAKNTTGTKTPENFASHHFKMYGPAIEKQSFLDKWKDKMMSDKNKFSVIKAIRD